MKPQRVLSNTPPWTWFTLAGLAILAGVDAARRTGVPLNPVVIGSLPNLVAVPVLTFGFLMIRAPEGGDRRVVGRLFRRAWPSALVVVLAWELLQLTGNLVFDPIDVAATALGAVLTLLWYSLTVRRIPEKPS